MIFYVHKQKAHLVIAQQLRGLCMTCCVNEEDMKRTDTGAT